MAVDLFGKGTGQTLQDMAAGIASMADDLDAIRATLTTASPPEADTFAARLQIVPTQQTAEQAIITGLLVTSDTTDFYQLKIGNDIGLKFGLTSMVPQMLNFTGQNRIPLPAGITVTIAQQTVGGTAVISAILFYLSQPWVGKRN